MKSHFILVTFLAFCSTCALSRDTNDIDCSSVFFEESYVATKPEPTVKQHENEKQAQSSDGKYYAVKENEATSIYQQELSKDETSQRYTLIKTIYKTGSSDLKRAWHPSNPLLAIIAAKYNKRNQNGQKRDVYLTIFNAADKKEETNILLEIAGYINCLSWHPKGRFLVFTTKTGSAQLWDQDLKVTLPITAEGSILQALWHPKYFWLALLLEQKIHLYDLYSIMDELTLTDALKNLYLVNENGETESACGPLELDEAPVATRTFDTDTRGRPKSISWDDDQEKKLILNTDDQE